LKFIYGKPHPRMLEELGEIFFQALLVQRATVFKPQIPS